MEQLKKIDKSYLNSVRNKPENSGLVFEKYGKYRDINKYSDYEITEMIYGLYPHKKMILVDGDYFIDLKDVIEIVCDLNQTTYFKVPTKEDFITNAHNSISNIRTFYISNYWLITKSEINGSTKHRITRLLYKIGAIRQGRNKFKKLYSIKNDYVFFQRFEQGSFPKDLYYPIKRYINGLFFEDDYRISNFRVDSQIQLRR